MVHDPQLQNLCSKCKPTHRKIFLAIIHSSGACHHKLSSYKLIFFISPAHQNSVFFPDLSVNVNDPSLGGNHRPDNPRHIFHYSLPFAIHLQYPRHTFHYSLPFAIHLQFVIRHASPVSSRPLQTRKTAVSSLAIGYIRSRYQS